jgi:hypothetical protein
MTYKSRGGLHWLRLGRLTISWSFRQSKSVSRKRRQVHAALSNGALVLPL